MPVTSYPGCEYLCSAFYTIYESFRWLVHLMAPEEVSMPNLKAIRSAEAGGKVKQLFEGIQKNLAVPGWPPPADGLEKCHHESE